MVLGLFGVCKSIGDFYWPTMYPAIEQVALWLALAGTFVRKLIPMPTDPAGEGPGAYKRSGEAKVQTSDEESLNMRVGAR
jgi:hypothetical protein